MMCINKGLYCDITLPVPPVFAVDVISAVEFDRTGNHLATGDRGGRVVLFERTDTRDVSQLTASCNIPFPFYLVLQFCYSYNANHLAWGTPERFRADGLFAHSTSRILLQN